MIFNLLKSKPTLKELIPEGFVDIHSHILPGIDDGAKDVHESLELISKMREIGFSKIIGTPHIYPGLYENDYDSIKSSYEKIKNLNKEIILDYGAEYMADYNMLNNIEKKNLLTINGEFILLEFGFINIPENLFEIIFEIQHNGYKIILAHPERYRFFFKDFNKFNKLKKLGCYFQLNLLSVTGFYGNDIAKISDKLLENNMINFTGSDIHNNKQLEIFYDKVRIKNIEKLKKALESNNRFG